MLQNHFADEYVIAINRLFEYCANKKFLIQGGSITHNNIGNQALEISSKISKEFNIDIFGENTRARIIEFEHILGNIFSKHVIKKIKRNIDDEAELIIGSKNIDKNELNKFEIVIPKPFSRHVVKNLPIDNNGLLQMCRNPNYVSCIFPIESYSDYVITSLVEIKNIKRVLLVHLNRNSSTDSKTLKVSSLFAFKSEMTKHFLKNPIRLFLWAINIYGVNISLNNESRKFFRKTIIPTIPPHNTPEANLRSHMTGLRGRDIYYASYYAKPTLLGISYEVLYAVNLTKFLKDFKTGKI